MPPQRCTSATLLEICYTAWLQGPDLGLELPSEAELLSITQDLGLFAHLEQPRPLKAPAQGQLVQPARPDVQAQLEWDAKEDDELWRMIQHQPWLGGASGFAPTP